MTGAGENQIKVLLLKNLVCLFRSSVSDSVEEGMNYLCTTRSHSSKLENDAYSYAIVNDLSKDLRGQKSTHQHERFEDLYEEINEKLAVL